MNPVLSVLFGMGMGFSLSTVPGPAGSVILGHATREHAQKARKALLGMLTADLIVFTVCGLSLQTLTAFARSPIFQALAGAFFLLFALSAALKPAHAEESHFRSDQRTSTFLLTLVNPAAWIGAVSFLGLERSINDQPSSLYAILGMELGCALWFLPLIRLIGGFTPKRRLIVERALVLCVGIMGLWFLLKPFAASANELPFQCQEKFSVHQSVRLDCPVTTDRGTKDFHVLQLQGDFSQTSYDHGYLLAQELENGVLSETLWRISKGLQGSLLKQAIFSCYLTRIENSVSKEFLQGVRAMYQGYADRFRELGLTPRYTESQILSASLAVEVSNAAEGLTRNMEQNLLGTLASLGARCGITLPLHEGKQILAEIAGIGRSLKRGCIGFTVPSSMTGEGGLLHARNLDADLTRTWNTAPTLFLFKEPGKVRFAAMATAGDIYPGGVSGFNEHGISVTLHQMSTDKYRTHFHNRRGVMAPWLQQLILREARSIDDAVRLITDSGHFGAWTTLISDAKTGETASIEFSGKRVQVARRSRDLPFGQTNHFLGSEMQKQFFTYNFNKQLESESRLMVIENEMNAALKNRKTVDIRWMIDQLSGHQDAFEGFRSFGRTATKAYTVMSTITDAAHNELWVTLGERLPASHSHFLGFRIDWEKLSAQPLLALRTAQYADKPNWELSLERYTHAFEAFEDSAPQRSIALLTEAMALAERDGITEAPYRFMRARMYGEMKLWNESFADYNELWGNRDRLHLYGQSLIALYSAAMLNELGASPEESQSRLRFAKTGFENLMAERPHFDLKKKLKLGKKLRKGKKRELPEPEFVTIE